VPFSLLFLIALYGLARATLGWPSERYEGWLLLCILLLSLLPVFLLVLEMLASLGGSVEVPGGVRLSFASASLQAAAHERPRLCRLVLPPRW
jgi:hypothetical protein